ncbi:MAG: hypothetical protein GF332_01585 [Candidatus Moranbacteria bacterium]|nr:hypothetical protein [Candidatus Moranbacteria bacterium]
MRQNISDRLINFIYKRKNFFIVASILVILGSLLIGLAQVSETARRQTRLTQKSQAESTGLENQDQAQTLDFTPDCVAMRPEGDWILMSHGQECSSQSPGEMYCNSQGDRLTVTCVNGAPVVNKYLGELNPEAKSWCEDYENRKNGDQQLIQQDYIEENLGDHEQYVFCLTQAREIKEQAVEELAGLKTNQTEDTGNQPSPELGQNRESGDSDTLETEPETNQANDSGETDSVFDDSDADRQDKDNQVDLNQLDTSDFLADYSESPFDGLDNGGDLEETGDGGINRSDSSSGGGRIVLGTKGKGDQTYVGGGSTGLAAGEHVNSPDGPAAIYPQNSNQYKLWYPGYNSANWRIYMAEASNADNLSKVDNSVPERSLVGTNGRVPNSPKGFLDFIHTANPWVFTQREVRQQQGETEVQNDYIMYYSGYTLQAGAAWRIFGATSMDTYTWDKSRGRLQIDVSGENQASKPHVHVDSPAMVADIDSQCICNQYVEICFETFRMYHMWYSGFDGATWRIYHAKSVDPLWWSDSSSHQIALEPNSNKDAKDSVYVSAPSVILERKFNEQCCIERCQPIYKMYHMWYSGYDGATWRIFYTQSPTPSSFPPGEVVLDVGERGDGDNVQVVGPMVVTEDQDGLAGEAGGPYRMWYAGFDGAVWTIFSATSQNGRNWQKVDNNSIF